MNESGIRRRGPGKHETAARRRDLNTLVGWKNRPRNGKIARLPDALRLRINRMLDDGLSYRDIIRLLQQQNDTTLPYTISEMNLSNWFHGGFRDWQQDQLAPDVPRSLAVAASCSLRCPSPYPDMSLKQIGVNQTKSKLLKAPNSMTARKRQSPRGYSR